MRRIRWWIRLASFIVVAVALGATGFKQDGAHNRAQATASETIKAKDKAHGKGSHIPLRYTQQIARGTTHP